MSSDDGRDDDPFSDNPELEYAPTQAMSAIPGPDFLKQMREGTAPASSDEPQPTMPMGPGPAGSGPAPGPSSDPAPSWGDSPSAAPSSPQGPYGPGQQGPGQQGPGQQGPGQQGPGQQGPGQQGPGQQGPGQQGPGGPQPSQGRPMPGGMGPGQQQGPIRVGPAGPYAQHQAPTRQGMPGGAYGETPQKKFGISSVIALIGGLLLIVSFFSPLLEMKQMFEDVPDGENQDNPLRELMESDFGEELFAKADDDTPEVVKDSADALGLLELAEELADAEDTDEMRAIMEDFSLSPYNLARFGMVMDFGDWTEIPEVDEREAAEYKAAGRMFWIFIAWIPLAGFLIVLMALIRMFKPLNALQVAFSGVVGLSYLGLGLGLMAAEQEMALSWGSSVTILLAGAAVTWISAFAGLSKTNWWKAPLIGLVVMAVFHGSIAYSVMFASEYF